MQVLKNEHLTIKINNFGAELSSIVSNETKHEYLWQADPKYWKRHSPVLFPIVGSLWNGEFHYEDKAYKMSQHGFARDYNFDLLEETENSVSYLLKSSEKTKEVYPFYFELIISYELIDSSVKVEWNVRNTGNKTMYFQIGAHPAFYYPDFDPNDDLRGYFKFDNKKDLIYTLIKEKGCVDPQISFSLDLDNDDHLRIDANTFEKNALIIENKQVRSVALLTKDKAPYLSVHFDAPLVGLWSPTERDCPFVCIEPWYGRCDRVGYNGDISGRDYMNSLDRDCEFVVGYTVEIL